MSDTAADPAPAAPPAGRPRLNLKPRDDSAAAKLAEERAAGAKASPFGAAKPREAILAARTGKKEEDILKEEASKERLHVSCSGGGRRGAEERKGCLHAEQKNAFSQLGAHPSPPPPHPINAGAGGRAELSGAWPGA